jgi:hypothetical protein
VHEARVAPQPVGFGNLLRGLEHETHETVALALQARHHFTPIYAHLAVDVHAEAGAAIDAVRRFRRRDEELRGHAAHARAGGSIGPALDDDGALARGSRGAIGGEARGARADDGDVDIEWSAGHVSFPCLSLGALRCGGAT